jgi:hypothetical protein
MDVGVGKISVTPSEHLRYPFKKSECASVASPSLRWLLMKNDVGDAFSSETFLTNLAAMSPEAKKALFGHSGFPGLRERVDQMARMASVRREGAQVFANPSGTARQTGVAAWVAALGSSIATGNAAGIAGAIGGPVGAKLMARKFILLVRNR